MEKNVVYKVTKSSTDTTFEKGDVIWRCEDGTIMRANRTGWIDPEECPEESLDFCFEKDDRYKVIHGCGYVGICAA